MNRRADDSDRFANRALVASVTFIAILALALFIWYSIQVLLLIFAGVLIAILLRGLSDEVSDWTKLGHRTSTILVMLVLAGSIFLLGGVSKDSLLRETSQLAERLPQAMETLRHKIAATDLGELLLRQAPQFGAIMSGRGDLLGSVTGVVSSTLGAMVSLIVVLFVGIYLAVSPRLYVKGIIHLVPPARRDRMAEVLGAIGYTLRWWMIGQAVDMVVIGVATWIGLWLLGVPLAMLLGLIAALFNFIPNFGPLFSMIPAVLLALGSDDPSKAIYVVILFMVLQTLEGYLLMPLIQRRAVDLPGAMTIVSQVLLGILAGLPGLALAAPLAAATLVAVKMLYVEDTLGDTIKTPADHDARAEVREVKAATREVERQTK